MTFVTVKENDGLQYAQVTRIDFAHLSSPPPNTFNIRYSRNHNVKTKDGRAKNDYLKTKGEQRPLLTVAKCFINFWFSENCIRLSVV